MTTLFAFFPLAALPLAAAEQAAEWMRLRMIWTQQEHLAQYRFAREVWDVLTPEQQQKLISGEWKHHAKQDTGHTRGDATAWAEAPRRFTPGAGELIQLLSKP